jgi:ribonuclease BN (tRNA processing enzyme)
VKLTVIGCSGSMPSADSPASCYLVEADGFRLVLDLGNGALGALQREVDLFADRPVEAVLLSHGHIDHCADVASLSVARTYGPGASALPPLNVFGPSGIGRRLAAIEGGATSALEIAEYPAASFEVGPFTVTTCAAAHPVPAVSIRLDAEGCSLVYSGDTGPNPELEALARGTDLALFEASCIGEGHAADLHMSASEAGQLARRSSAKALMITHLVPWVPLHLVRDEAAEAFGAEIEVAAPGLRRQIAG